MKTINIGTKQVIIMLLSLFILTWCFNKEKEEWNITTTNETKTENKVYNEIADKKEWLKNATSDDLDKIIQEDLKLLNTPSSKYPFFEQLTTKKWDIQEIKKAWWMEVTRWQIYLYWLDSKYSFLNDILTDNEKLYSFHQEWSDYNFFYLDWKENDFISKIKTKNQNFKEVSNDTNMINSEFTNNWNKYMMMIVKSNWNSRDQIDSILDLTNKIKISVNLVK